MAEQAAIGPMAYRELLGQLASMVPGKPVHWVGKNYDGLQRSFEGRVKRLVILSGHNFRLEVVEVKEHRGPTHVQSHPGATLLCFRQIQELPDLSEARTLEIHEVNARVYLQEAE